MSKAQPTLILLRKRLVEWGFWSYHIETMGLSYSGESVFSKLARAQGGLVSNSTVFHEQVEEVESLITRMASSGKDLEIRTGWGKVIRIHYTRFNESISIRIQLSHIAQKTYYRYLNDAHEWLSEELFL